MPNRNEKIALAVAFLGAVALCPAVARAGIKTPGDHPSYTFEAEPHLSIGYRGGIGPGFRGTFIIVDNGFIRTINNSVGIGFGAEWLFYAKDCKRPGPGPEICESVGDVLVPVVLQWNFWIDRSFSVFGEPGFALHFQHGTDHGFVADPFVIYGGARVHFSDSVALTLRLGAPQIWKHDSTISIGVSFML